MRIPLPTQLKTRVGNISKDARLKNSYTEIRGESGVVRKRPGNTDLGLIEAGASQLLTCWNGLLSVVGDSLASLVITTVPPGYSSADVVFSAWPDFTPSDPVFQMFEYVNGEFLGGIYNEDDTLGVLLSINESGGIVTRANRIDSSSVVDTTPYGVAASATTIAIATRNDYGYGSFEGEIWTAPLAVVPYVFTQKSTSGTYSGAKMRYGGGKFAAILTNFTTASEVRRSSDDGSTWQSVSLSGGLRDCCYDGSLWLFGGRTAGSAPLVITSSDLITFTTVTTSGLPGTGQVRSIAYSSIHDYYFLVINGGDVYKSSDYTAWSAVTVDDVGYTVSKQVCSNSDGEVFLTASLNILAQYGVDGDQFTTIGEPFGNTIAAHELEFVTGGDGLTDAGGEYKIVTETGGGDKVTPTPITDLSPVTPSLALFAEATGSSQSAQQLFIKSDDQAWIYTR